jgi:hypothetical protein
MTAEPLFSDFGILSELPVNETVWFTGLNGTETLANAALKYGITVCLSGAIRANSQSLSRGVHDRLTDGPEWRANLHAALTHRNTEHPHVHVALRGWADTRICVPSTRRFPERLAPVTSGDRQREQNM